MDVTGDGGTTTPVGSVDGRRADAELILYACPTGPLADMVHQFFDDVSAHPTEAQRYPPHCTLTGFFHDDLDAIPSYVEAAGTVAEDAVDAGGGGGGSVEADAAIDVRVAELQTDPGWVGLRIVSADLERLTADFAKRVADIPTRVDDIRIKDGLHLSLAYGHSPDAHEQLARRAVATVAPAAAVGWDLRLYRREPGDRWTIVGSWPLVANPR